MTRPAAEYGVSACPSCRKTAANGLQLQVTGATRRDLLPFQRGRKILTGGGERRDLGPRFPETVARPWAEVRCECGSTSWVLAPAAIADAEAMNAAQPQEA